MRRKAENRHVNKIELISYCQMMLKSVKKEILDIIFDILALFGPRLRSILPKKSKNGTKPNLVLFFLSN